MTQMHFGATLRMLRTEAGVSLRALGEQIGVSNAYLSRVENGHDAAPTTERLAAIARVLGLSPAVLIELARRVDPTIAGYLERVPMAAALFLEIARRDLSTTDLLRVRAFMDKDLPPPKPSPPAAGRVGRLVGGSGIVSVVRCSELADAVEMAALRLGEGVTARRISTALLERDKACPSAVGAGVAIPHAVVEGVEHRVAIATLARPMRHATPDGKPLRLIVAIVHPRGGPELVHTLGQVARLANLGLAAALCEAGDPQAALEHFEALHG